jgi:hypothetical protein
LLLPPGLSCSPAWRDVLYSGYEELVERGG